MEYSPVEKLSILCTCLSLSNFSLCLVAKRELCSDSFFMPRPFRAFLNPPFFLDEVVLPDVRLGRLGVDPPLALPAL